MTIKTDQYHIDLILKGDTNAFAVLVDRYKDLVFTLAIRMLKNREEAEEVSQDTFIKVYKSLNRFKGDSKFSTWIYRITYNTCLDRLKKNKKFLKDISIDEFTENQLKTIDNALENMQKVAFQETIQECIKILPADDGFLLTLFYFDNQSLDEIAITMNMTANHVKVKLFRSRKKLATILKQRLEPEIIENYEREYR